MCSHYTMLLPSYVGNRSKLTDTERHERIIAQALKELRAWKRHYGHLEEMTDVVEVIGKK